MKAAAAFIALCALLAFAIGGMGRSRLAQVAKGGDVLSVAFADAKAVISAAMVHKADSYFHGGIDMKCNEISGRGHDEHEEHHEEHEGHEDHERCKHGEHLAATAISDPWGWINGKIRAPEKHVHLDGKRSVEMMPWLWASVKADPHNVDAWTTAWYVANTMMKDRELARRILSEARAANPQSLDVVCAEARFAYDEGKGDAAAAERLLEEGRRIGKGMCGGDLSRLSEHDAETFCSILDYLSVLYLKGGRRAEIARLVEEVRATGAKTPVESWMRQRMN